MPSKLLTDSTFLDFLDSHVQAVTKLTRDVSSGTGWQEINFWFSLERALEGIEAQLRTKEVRVVLHALRNAKRFYATASFIADTGLKSDAMDLGGSPLLFLWDKRAHGQWQSTTTINYSTTSSPPPTLTKYTNHSSSPT